MRLNVNVLIRARCWLWGLISALNVDLSIIQQDLARTTVEFDTTFLFLFFFFFLFSPSCLWPKPPVFFPLSWQKTDIWSAGDLRGFENILWVVWRVSFSLESGSFYSCEFVTQSLLLWYNPWGFSSSVWWSYLICTGLDWGGRGGDWARAVAMVTPGPGIIIGPGIWFQEKQSEMFLKGLCSSVTEDFSTVELL